MITNVRDAIGLISIAMMIASPFAAGREHNQMPERANGN